MEAYKLLAQIMIKQGKIDDTLEMLTDIAQKNENGDIYYLMAKIFEMNEDYNSQKDCLELALNFQGTLTFSIGSIQEELKKIKLDS